MKKLLTLFVSIVILSSYVSAIEPMDLASNQCNNPLSLTIAEDCEDEPEEQPVQVVKQNNGADTVRRDPEPIKRNYAACYDGLWNEVKPMVVDDRYDLNLLLTLFTSEDYWFCSDMLWGNFKQKLQL